jgi:hypothetical protein
MINAKHIFITSKMLSPSIILPEMNKYQIYACVCAGENNVNVCVSTWIIFPLKQNELTGFIARLYYL